MSEIFYKAIRPNGESFHDPYFRWLPEGWQSGDPIPADWVVKHPNPGAKIGKDSGARASEYLSIATVPTDCTSFEWPCVLLEVEAVGRACLNGLYWYPNKRRVRAARVLRERPAHEVFGPQGAEVVAILERTGQLTAEEVERLSADWVVARVAAREAARIAAWEAARKTSRDAAWVAAWVAAWEAAWDATRKAARGAAWEATREATRGDARGTARAVSRDAAVATLSRDLISTEQYNVLVAPWKEVTGDE